MLEVQGYNPSPHAKHQIVALAEMDYGCSLLENGLPEAASFPIQLMEQLTHHLHPPETLWAMLYTLNLPIDFPDTPGSAHNGDSFLLSQRNNCILRSHLCHQI